MTPITARIIGVGCVLVGTVSGAVLGYAFANLRLKEYYKDIAGDEIKKAREFYAILYKKEAEDINTVAAKLLKEEAAPSDVVAAAKALNQYQGKNPSRTDPRVELLGGTNPPMDIVIQNVFRQEDPGDEPTAEELRRRTEEAPYIISKKEHFESTMEYEQVTLTYYVPNNILTEQDDTEIDDIDEVVGQENLNHFGHLSGDKNVLYVRNDYTQTDYEILRHEGDYAEVVAGLGGK